MPEIGPKQCQPNGDPEFSPRNVEWYRWHEQFPNGFQNPDKYREADQFRLLVSGIR